MSSTILAKPAHSSGASLLCQRQFCVTWQRLGDVLQPLKGGIRLPISDRHAHSDAYDSMGKGRGVRPGRCLGYR